MSLWYCPDHGLTGPGACCGAAGRAGVVPNPTPPIAYFDATPMHPERAPVPAVDPSRCIPDPALTIAALTSEVSALREAVDKADAVLQRLASQTRFATYHEDAETRMRAEFAQQELTALRAARRDGAP